METLCLFVEVPLCAFRPRWSREYQDTYPLPPPSTVYGMLLSLAGVDWQQKGKYAGVHMALALEGEPKQSRVLRKFRRFSASKVVDPFTFRRPDYQDLLLWLKLWVWLHDGEAQASLVEKVRTALTPSRRGGIQRYGGLSLGESSHLINDISLREPDGEGRFLCRYEAGVYSLPVWVHHPRNGQGKTRLERFSFLESESLVSPPQRDLRWIPIGP